MTEKEIFNIWNEICSFVENNPGDYSTRPNNRTPKWFSARAGAGKIMIGTPLKKHFENGKSADSTLKQERPLNFSEFHRAYEPMTNDDPIAKDKSQNLSYIKALNYWCRIVKVKPE
ncbi:MAG: hypothetical protein IKJ34_03615 [Mailhella sp.]|nr:hypothetical protein [Mailhella sp.]